MAVIKMKKMRLLGLKNEERIILDALQKSGCAEIIRNRENLEEKETSNPRQDSYSEKLTKLSFAISFVDECIKERKKIAKDNNNKKYKSIKKPLFAYKHQVDYDRFSLISTREYELLNHIEVLSGYKDELMENKASTSKLLSMCGQIIEFFRSDVVLEQFANNKNVYIKIGSIPESKAKAFDSFISGRDLLYSKVLSRNKNVLTAIVMFHKESYDTVYPQLTALSFDRMQLSICSNPEEAISSYLSDIEKLKKRRIELLDSAINLYSVVPEFKLLYDYYNFEIMKTDSSDNFHKTAYTFILEAFVPETHTAKLEKLLKSATDKIEIDFIDVTKEDNPPTLVKNNRFVAPFEAVTNMYSMPSHFERDPNSFVALFFFMFFGIIMADAGYGILLALGAFILVKNFKMNAGMRQLVLVIGLGGISTLIWGTLFGGWFGIEDIAPLWFNPMYEPITMLGLCLGAGVIQILFGIGIKGFALLQEKRYFDALCEAGLWYLFFAGIGLVALGAIPSLTLFGSTVSTAAFGSAGTYLTIGALALILLTGGRKEKGIIKKITKGSMAIVHIVQYLSDILSYARMFGLALAGTVVALVMNTMAGMLFTAWYMYPFGIAVIIAGHSINLFICILSAYIHNCRLQYIEFFPRFYTGGGHKFQPFGADLKYNIIKTPKAAVNAKKTAA